MAVTRTFIETGTCTDFDSVPVLINIGSGSAGETIVLGFSYEDSDSIVTIDLGGNAFTLAFASKHSGGNTTEIWYGAAPVGTSALLSATLTGVSISDASYAIYRLTGNAAAPTDSDGTTNSLATIALSTVTVPTDGVGIWMWTNDTATACTWTNATEDFDIAAAATNNQFSGASTTTAGTPTVTADGATDDQALVGVAFGPSGVSVTTMSFGLIAG
jgi:hypothetical protein